MASLEAECLRASGILKSCEGAFLAEVNYSAADAGDADDSLEILLTQVPALGSVKMEIRSIRYLEVSKPPGLGMFVDRVDMSYLPASPDPWPREAEGLVVRFKGLPELVWMQIVGPAEIQVVADSLVSVTSA